MAIDTLDFGPQTPGEELQLQAMQRAIHIYERAKTFRMVVVFATFAVSIAPWSELFPRLGNAPTSLPAVLGICFFASFFALCLEWSSRIDCQSRREGYEAYRQAGLTAIHDRLGQFDPRSDLESRDP